MVVVTRRRAPQQRFSLGLAERSPTLAVPGSVDRVRAAQAAAGGWVHGYPMGQPNRFTQGFRGLGTGVSGVPTWVWWALGGAAVGITAGIVAFK